MWFGILKMAIDSGDPKRQEVAWENLCAIALSIPTKHNWPEHPEGTDGWKGIVHQVLGKQLSRVENLSLAETYQLMIGKKFAFIYKAFENAFIDDWDKRKKRVTEVTQTRGGTHLELAALPFRSGDKTPEEKAEAALLVTKIERAILHAVPPKRAILETTRDVIPFLEILTNEDEKGIREWFKKEQMRRRNVSDDQAAYDLDKFKEQASNDPEIKPIIEGIEALSSLRLEREQELAAERRKLPS